MAIRAPDGAKKNLCSKGFQVNNARKNGWCCIYPKLARFRFITKLSRPRPSWSVMVLTKTLLPKKPKPTSCKMQYDILDTKQINTAVKYAYADILYYPCQWCMASAKWATTMFGDHCYHCWLDEPLDMTMCVWKSLPRVPGIWDQRDTQAPAQQFIGCKIWDHKHKLKYSGVDEAVRKTYSKPR